MKTDTTDPWRDVEISDSQSNSRSFEDSFVEIQATPIERLSDSEEYLEKLYSRLKNLKKGTSKKDLVQSLSTAKTDCLARLITSERSFTSEEETELASNPLIRHIAPHLQALTSSELVHLLKADVLEVNSEKEQQSVETSQSTEATSSNN